MSVKWLTVDWVYRASGFRVGLRWHAGARVALTRLPHGLTRMHGGEVALTWTAARQAALGFQRQRRTAGLRRR